MHGRHVADVDKFPADAASVALAGTVAGDAMADPGEAAELFDVEMDHLAGCFVLVADHRHRRFEGAASAQPEPDENPADGGRRDPDRACDLLAGPVLAAELGNPLDARHPGSADRGGAAASCGR